MVRSTQRLPGLCIDIHPSAAQDFPHLGWQRRFKFHPCAVCRVMKGEARGVQAESLRALSAMPLITDDGVAHVGAVYAQLVRAPRHGLKLNERHAAASPKYAQARLGLFAALHDSPLRLRFRVATDRGADVPFVPSDTT